MRTAPTHSSYARHGSVSEAPNLRRRLDGAWIPPLGVTGESSLRDVSGFAGHGVPTGALGKPLWAMQKGRRCLLYSAANAMGTLCGTRLHHPSELTITAWINVSTTGSVFTICSQSSASANYNFSFELGRATNTNRLGIIWAGVLTAFVGNTTLTMGEWYHVAVVRSGVAGAWTAEVFLNGRPDGSTTTATNPNGAAGGGTSIGVFNDATFGLVRTMNGYISDLCIWPYALPKAAIYQHYVDSMAMWRMREDVMPNGAVSSALLKRMMLEGLYTGQGGMAA